MVKRALMVLVAATLLFAPTAGMSRSSDPTPEPSQTTVIFHNNNAKYDVRVTFGTGYHHGVH